MEECAKDWILLALKRHNEGSIVWSGHVGNCCDMVHFLEAGIGLKDLRIATPIMRVVGEVVVLEEKCFILKPSIH